jgi:predicted unusual protein kinase regulating ubiquinone biosynthesis (AarF/ABC1/UbiB family)
MFKQSWFIIKTIGNISYNGIKYLFNRDYDNFIINIANYLSNENLFYVKIMQALSSNNDLLTPRLTDYFINFTDNVPYTCDEVDYSFLNTIKEVQDAHPELNIDQSTLTYINSGIIAIVFKANMNGKDIIIKTVRKNIYSKINQAIINMEFIVNILKHFHYFKLSTIVDIFMENKKLMLEQSNFINEMNNMVEFRKKIRNQNEIVIPFVYEEFTKANPNIIVMDFIKGYKLKDIANPIEMERYTNIMAKFWVKCYIFYGMYHCDIHPGNVIFMKDSNNGNLKICLIDFGIVGTLTKDEKNNLLLFMMNIGKKDYDEVTHTLLSSFTQPPGLVDTLTNDEYDDIYQNIKSICKKKFINFENIAAIDILNMNKYLYKYNYKMSNDFSKLELALLISDSVINKLVSDKRYFNYLIDAIKEIIPDCD